MSGAGLSWREWLTIVLAVGSAAVLFRRFVRAGVIRRPVRLPRVAKPEADPAQSLSSATGSERNVVMVVVLGGLGLLAAGPLPSMVIAGVAAAIPALIGRWRRGRQRRRFETALPGLLDETARAMRAGLSPGEALRDTVRTAQRIVGPDGRNFVVALESGVSLSTALDEWQRRARSLGLQHLGVGLRVGVAAGAMNPRGIDAVAATLRERVAVRADVAVQTTQAHLSAAVMTVAPMLFCSFLVLGDGRASRFLLHTPAGLACAGVGVGLDAVAGLWMIRATRNAA